MCNDCARKMREAFKFKSMCLCIDNIIIPYVDETGNSVDLLEIYAKEKGNELLTENLYGHKVCRLCMQLIKGKFLLVREVEVDMIEKYIPEINISVVEDPVICKQCFDSLGTHSTFIKDCLEMEKEIKTENSVVKQEQNYYEEECLKNKLNVETFNEGDQYQIKTECIDIKSEEDSESETSQRSSPTHNVVSEMHKCDKCSYESKSKNNWTHHQLRHMDLSHAKMYKCDKCSYESIYRGHIIRHQLIHKDPSRVQMYKCDECDFETKHRKSIKRHQILHKTFPQVQMYKCDKCSFVSKHKDYMRKHQLTHRIPSKNEMYQCDECSYETKHKSNLNKHRSKHKDPSQVQMYKCDKCSYASRYRNHLKRHQLRHNDCSHVQITKCDKCSYESKFMSALSRHQLKHKDPSQVRMYRCDMCTFETKYKRSITRHQSVHRTSSEVRM